MTTYGRDQFLNISCAQNILNSTIFDLNCIFTHSMLHIFNWKKSYLAKIYVAVEVFYTHTFETVVDAIC